MQVLCCVSLFTTPWTAANQASLSLFDLLPVQGTFKGLSQHHNLKASILRCSAFFTVQLISACDYWENHSFDYVDPEINEAKERTGNSPSHCSQSRKVLLSGFFSQFLRVLCLFFLPSTTKDFGFYIKNKHKTLRN